MGGGELGLSCAWRQEEVQQRVDGRCRVVFAAAHFCDDAVGGADVGFQQRVVMSMMG
jgi:hypothetical protein